MPAEKAKAMGGKAPEPKAKTKTPDPKAVTPELKTKTPEPKAKMKTPELKGEAPEPKTKTPEPKAKTPEPKEKTPEPKAKPRLQKQASLPAPTTPFSAKKGQSAFGQLLDAASAECRRLGIWNDELQRDLPKRWEKHGDLVLLPHDSFTNLQWRTHGRSLWAVVAKSMNASRLARKKRLGADDARHTYVEMLFGKDGWVQHIDNGVKYNYDVTKCLYSNENAAERLRIATLPCATDIVCDLFAGLGYLTLAFLMGGGARHVYAIDWDPEIVEALRRNLTDNDVADRCTVLEGDCRRVLPVAGADRVVLSLLPSSKAYMLAACKALKADGGWLHIHDTLPSPAPSKESSPRPRAALQRQATAPAAPAPPTPSPPVPPKAPLETQEKKTKKEDTTSLKKKVDKKEEIKEPESVKSPVSCPKIEGNGLSAPAKPLRPKSPLQKQKAVEKAPAIKTPSPTPPKSSKSPTPPKAKSPTPPPKENGAVAKTGEVVKPLRVEVAGNGRKTSKAGTPPKMAALKEDEESASPKSPVRVPLPPSPTPNHTPPKSPKGQRMVQWRRRARL